MKNNTKTKHRYNKRAKRIRVATNNIKTYTEELKTLEASL